MAYRSRFQKRDNVALALFAIPVIVTHSDDFRPLLWGRSGVNVTGTIRERKYGGGDGGIDRYPNYL